MQEYVLASGDQIEVRLIGQKDLDTKQTIVPDGAIEEARAYAGKDYKGEIHYGDVIHVDTSTEPNWISDN